MAESNNQVGMDLAKTLVRSVVRSFYDTKHILVVDALVIHSALRDDDLAYLMNMNTKDLHKLCGKLKEDRFLTVHTRQELKEGQSRSVSRTWYFIDYRLAIDAIKWRVYKIDKETQGIAVPADERKEYFCLRVGCMAEYTQLEVLDNTPGPLGFTCKVCSSVLKHDPEGNSGGHKQSTRMNSQFRFITELLPQIDAVVVPECTFETAERAARPVVRDALHQVVASVAVDPATHRQATIKGLANTGPKSIEVSVTTGDGPTEAEKEAERLRKEKHAQQNALPSWISQSTITGESYDLDPSKAPAGAASASSAAGAGGSGGANVVVSDSKQDANDSKDHAEMEDLFAKIRREQAEEAARKAAEEESDDDEEDDFEDVTEPVATTANNSNGGTPSSAVPPSLSVPAAGSTLPIPRQSSLKRDSSSGPNSGGASPNGSDGRPVKKVKVEEPPPAPAAITAGDNDESDDDIEFEDV